MARAGDFVLTADDVRGMGNLALRVAERGQQEGQAADGWTTESLAAVAEFGLLNQALAARAAELGAAKDASYARALELSTWQATSRQAAEVLQRSVANESTETLYRAAWEIERAAAGGTPASDPILHFRFIFIRTAGLDDAARAERQQRAAQVLDRVRAGADFVKVLLEVSESQTRTTDTLMVGPDTPNFSEKLYQRLKALPEGSISDVIASPAGLNIFQIVRREEQSGAAPTFEAAMEDIRQRSRLGMRAPYLVLIDRLGKEFKVSPVLTQDEVTEMLADPKAVVASSGEHEITIADLQLWNSMMRGQAFGAPGDAEALTPAAATSAAKSWHDILLLLRAARERGLLESMEDSAARTAKAELAQRWLQSHLRRQAAEASSSTLETWLAGPGASGAIPTTVSLTAGCQFRFAPAPGHADIAPLVVQEQAEALKELFASRSSAPADFAALPPGTSDKLAKAGIALERISWDALAVQELEQRGIDYAPMVRTSSEPLEQALASDLERKASGYSFSLVRLKEVGVKPTFEVMPEFVRANYERYLLMKLRDELQEQVARDMKVEPAMMQAMDDVRLKSRH